MSRVPQQRSGLDRRAVSGEQQITGINVLGFLPPLIRNIPTLVILGRRDRAVAYFVFDERVGVRPSSENLAWSGWTCSALLAEHSRFHVFPKRNVRGIQRCRGFGV